jgi:hypothetical protein
VSISLSSNPQRKLQLKSNRLLKLQKTGDEIWINLKKRILAIPVPTTPKTTINKTACCTFLLSHRKKPVKTKSRTAEAIQQSFRSNTQRT